jgi:hypothetical protein
LSASCSNRTRRRKSSGLHDDVGRVCEQPACTTSGSSRVRRSALAFSPPAFRC